MNFNEVERIITNQVFNCSKDDLLYGVKDMLVDRGSEFSDDPYIGFMISAKDFNNSLANKLHRESRSSIQFIYAPINNGAICATLYIDNDYVGKKAVEKGFETVEWGCGHKVGP